LNILRFQDSGLFGFWASPLDGSWRWSRIYPNSIPRRWNGSKIPPTRWIEP
jgi:hypothetical protein